MLQLGEIDTSHWNYFHLSELLLVPLIILHGAEKGRVKPHFSTSVCLSRLRRLSWVLALCPRGSCLSPKSHKKFRNEGDEAGREKNTHTRNPRCVGKVLKLAMTRGQRRSHLKSKTLASKKSI